MGTIVVGVDGSDGAQRALGFAIEEAKRRGTRVRVVMAWHVPAMAYGGGFAPPVDPRDFDESSRAVVEDAVSKLAAEASGVEVERVTRSGQTVQVLVEEARASCL